MSEINSINPTPGTGDPSESGTQIEDKKTQEASTQATDIMDTSADPTPTITAVPPAPATGGLSPPPTLGVQDVNKQPVSYIRSQSPAKRPASEINGGDEAANYAMSPMSINNEQGGAPLSEPDIVSSESAPSTAYAAAQSSSATKVPESATEFGVLAATATVIETPSTLAPSATPVPQIPSRPSSPPPTIDQQLATVMLGIHRPLQEGEEYCVISGRWLKKFMSREKESQIVLTKEEIEEGLGPIDNSELVDKVAQQKLMTEGVILLDPTNAGIPADVNGTAAEADFSPLAPGFLGEDFEVIPFDTWEFLVNIHGVTKNSPPPLKRKAVNTQIDSNLASNIQVELHPPTFTVYRLRDPSAETTHTSLGVGAKPAPKILAGRSEKVQALLKKAKSLAGFDMSRKVRVWRLMNNGGVSLNDSRSPSPANGKKDSNKGVIYDMAAFLELDSSEKELVTILEDRTNDKNYNGKFSINMAGLGDGGDILLEEQDSSGNWISEQASKAAKNNGGMFSNTRAKFGNFINRKANSAASSRSSSPARNANTNKAAVGVGSSTSIMSRGREKKPGRPLGCCGLQNLGNTCYMNSALQCLRNCEELTKYFLSGKYQGELNPSNPLAHGGNVARSYADLLGHMFAPSSPASHAPRQFKNTIGRYGPSFSGYGQQDSQEFLAFLLDGLHEDLNRIHKKPYMEKPDSTDEMVGNDKLIAELADKCWNIYKARNDSAVADLFGGMYKSTLVCPMCDKVSITFDPFMDLTLPLPVENVWSKEIIFYPAGGKNLLKIPVDMDRNSTIKGLKEYIGNKLQIDPKKIMGSELYKNKFFKHYEDAKSVSIEIPLRDEGIFYELDEVPTNYPSPKQVRSLISRNDWDDEKLSERIIVPVFNRKKARVLEYFGMPFFIVLDKEDQKDYYAILAKICERYQSQTSMSLFGSQDESGTETPDQVLVGDEDESINEGKRVSEKDEDEGYVDVHMEDVGEVLSPKVFGKYSRETLDKLAPLFTMKIAAKNHSGDRGVPTGWSDLHVGVELATRIVKQRAPTPPPRKQYRSRLQTGSDESDEDDIQDDAETFANAPETQDSDEDDRVNHSFDKRGGSFDSSSPENFYGKPNIKKSKLHRTTASGSRPGTPSYSTSQREEQGPLLRLGEAIVCEWEDGTYDSVFGGRNKNDDMRGYPLWEPVSEIALYQDEELAARRKLRESRRKRGIHLEDCLAEFAKEEILSETDPWYCPRCKEFRRARKKFELWKSPDILVVHLKRFSSSRISRDKIDALIDFPVEGLDLNDRIGLREDGKENIYDLFAVDNHYGGLGGGHYTAYAKNFENGLWYYFDDSSVSPVGNTATVVTTAAYLLFYRRRTNKPLGGSVFERILGDSGTSSQEEDEEEESGNGNGNDSGISDNSPSSSPRMRGMIGRHGSSDNFISSSPLVSGRAGSSTTTGFKSFGGAGSSSTLFDIAPSSALPPSPQGSSSSSGRPPSYGEALVEERLFGPQLPPKGLAYDDSFIGPATAPKSVNFTFGHGREAENLHHPTTPTSTAGDVGDSDRDADAEEDVDVDMLGAIDIVDSGKQKFQATEFVGLGEGVGTDEEEDCEGSVHEFELSPEREGEGDNEEEGELVEREGVPVAVDVVTLGKATATAAAPPPPAETTTVVTTTEKSTTGEETLAGKMDTSA